MIEYINWSRTYRINHDKGNFKLYLSHHKDGFYYATIIYYLTTGNWSESTIIDLDFKDQRFYGNDEGTVYNAVISFIEDSLPGKYTVTLESESDR